MRGLATSPSRGPVTGAMDGYPCSRTVGVAQLVELLVVVQVVAGSSPVAHPREEVGDVQGFA